MASLPFIPEEVVHYDNYQSELNADGSIKSVYFEGGLGGQYNILRFTPKYFQVEYKCGLREDPAMFVMMKCKWKHVLEPTFVMAAKGTHYATVQLRGVMICFSGSLDFTTKIVYALQRMLYTCLVKDVAFSMDDLAWNLARMPDPERRMHTLLAVQATRPGGNIFFGPPGHQIVCTRIS